MDGYIILSRASTGKNLLNRQKEKYIEISGDIHLGTANCLMLSGKQDDNDTWNADETSFIIFVENGRTMGYCGDLQVKFAYTVSRGEEFTVVVLLSGSLDARIDSSFTFLYKKDRNYPIRNIPDNLDGVSYRTGPKACMETTLMIQWLSDNGSSNRFHMTVSIFCTFTISVWILKRRSI